MASTPPPLPSSSEDSDFDDDDFGCFSSAPVKASSNTLQNTEKEAKCDVDKSGNSTANSADASSLKDETETFDRSDSASSNPCESMIYKEEEMPTDLFASDKFRETDLTEPSQFLTSEVIVGEGHCDIDSSFSETGQDCVDSKEIIVNDKISDNSHSDKNCVEINDVKSKSEAFEYSTVKDTEKSVEAIERDNSSITDSLENSSNDISDEPDTKCNQVVNNVDAVDSDRPSNIPFEGSQEEDEFGAWSDMQTSQFEGVMDNSKQKAENDSLHKRDNNGDSPESKNDRAAIDSVESMCDSNPLPNDISPNIPLNLDDIPKEVNHSEHSVSPDDNKIEDDGDDFGDFADFSSHQVNDGEKEEDVPSFSFRSNNSDDNQKERDQDVNSVGNSDVNYEKQNAAEENVDSNQTEDDDFDDEWGFQSAKTNDNDNGSDDFGNFGSADNANDDGDWASFNETSMTPATAALDDDEDFNDFSESDFQEAPSCTQSESVPSKVQESTNKVEKVVFLYFQEDSYQRNQRIASQNHDSCDKNKADVEVGGIDNLSSVIEMGLKVTPHAKEETWTIVKELRNKDPVVCTWGRLKDVNSSHALDYGWSSSLCCQEIYNTLHIDTKNVLFSQKKQSVPFYASGLGILEPIRGGPNPAEKSQHLVATTPALLDTSKPEESKKSLVMDIPPVDFDWGSSGLTNPLKVFKNDSFNNGLTSLEPFSDMLHKNIEPSKELSSEAKSILSKIPNLNFMRSNVLMFPIKD